MELTQGLLWFTVFVFSTTAHEAAHAWAALRGGDPTAYLGGQVTLNPLPHIQREPFGMLVIPLLFALTSGWCLGWASTPYDPRWEQRHPRRAAWMAAAGPAANFALAIIALVLLKAGLASGYFVAPESVSLSSVVTAGDPNAALLGSFLSIALALNLILFVFNLLPVPPLDGATAINLFISEDLALRLRAVLHTPAVSLGLFGFVWFFFGSLVIRPLFQLILAVVHPDIPYGL